MKRNKRFTVNDIEFICSVEITDTMNGDVIITTNTNTISHQQYYSRRKITNLENEVRSTMKIDGNIDLIKIKTELIKNMINEEIEKAETWSLTQISPYEKMFNDLGFK